MKKKLKRSCRYPKRDPYSYAEGNYFNWAAGVRGTDKYHKIAAAFDAHALKLKSEGKIEQLAVEGSELAERVRGRIATMLGCSPRNIYFANSATMAAVTAYLGIMASTDATRVNFNFSSHQYPTVATLAALVHPQFLGLLTASNFTDGTFPNNLYKKFLNAIAKERGWDVEAREISEMDEPNPGFSGEMDNEGNYFDENGNQVDEEGNYVDGDPIDEEGAFYYEQDSDEEPERVPPIIHKKVFGIPVTFTRASDEDSEKTVTIESVEHCDRKTALVADETVLKRPLSDADEKNMLIRLLDCSHTFGVTDVKATSDFEFVFGSLSKGLGAECTLAFAYADDTMLDLISHAWDAGFLPKIAYQFHPATFLATEENYKYLSISLPVLASVDAALDDLLKEGIGARQHVLRTTQKMLLKNVSEIMPKYTSRFAVPKIASNAMPNQIVLPIFNLPDKSSELSNAGHEDWARIGEDLYHLYTSGDAIKLLKKIFAKYAVTEISEPFSFMQTFDFPEVGDEEGGLLGFEGLSFRISFRHDVDQDFSGLIEEFGKLQREIDLSLGKAEKRFVEETESERNNNPDENSPPPDDEDIPF